MIAASVQRCADQGTASRATRARSRHDFLRRFATGRIKRTTMAFPRQGLVEGSLAWHGGQELPGIGASPKATEQVLAHQPGRGHMAAGPHPDLMESGLAARRSLAWR